MIQRQSTQQPSRASTQQHVLRTRPAPPTAAAGSCTVLKAALTLLPPSGVIVCSPSYHNTDVTPPPPSFHLSDTGALDSLCSVSTSVPFLAFVCPTRSRKKMKATATATATPTFCVPTTHSDLCCLAPVRFCLLSFLSERQVALLLRVSHRTSRHLLAGYSFDQHIFVPRVLPADRSHGWQQWLLSCWRHCFFSSAPPSPPPARSLDMTALLSFCQRYSLRIRRLALPADFDGPLIDGTMGRSVLPASLTELWLGAVADGASMESCGGGEVERPWMFSSMDEEREFGMLIAPPDHPADTSRAIHPSSMRHCVNGSFNHSLPAGCLPEGLRALYCGPAYNQPLLPGSLPSSLIVCNLLGSRYAHPIAAGVLPAGLRDLLLSDEFNHPLLPGVLPPSLRRLFLGWKYNQPLLPDALPAGLEWLDMGCCFNLPLTPGCIPSSCTALRLTRGQPLPAGCLPAGLLQLSLGAEITHANDQAVLPAGLLYFAPARHQSLLPGFLPASVVRLDLCAFEGALVAGSIPSTVREVHAPDSRWAKVAALAPPSVRMCSHQRDPREFAERGTYRPPEDRLSCLFHHCQTIKDIAFSSSRP